MSLTARLRGAFQQLVGPERGPGQTGEPERIARGWDDYAKTWNPDQFAVTQGHTVRYLGDEWTAEDSEVSGTTYGLPQDVIDDFDRFLQERLIDPYLPADAREGLEIGPGGGRLTALLLPRTRRLHAADGSETMLSHLKTRFSGVDKLEYYHTDGMSLPPLAPGSLDYAIAFDVFVHFEPRLVYWYLKQIAPLLRPGGVGVIHYANLLTAIGWYQFEKHVERNLRQRTGFASFGVMCPELMGKFLTELGLDVVTTDTGAIPRDAVAVFKRPMNTSILPGHTA